MERALLWIRGLVYQFLLGGRRPLGAGHDLWHWRQPLNRAKLLRPWSTRVHSFPAVAKPVRSDYESLQRAGGGGLGRAGGGGCWVAGRGAGGGGPRRAAGAPLPALQNNSSRASACAARPWAQP